MCCSTPFSIRNLSVLEFWLWSGEGSWPQSTMDPEGHLELSFGESGYTQIFDYAGRSVPVTPVRFKGQLYTFGGF